MGYVGHMVTANYDRAERRSRERAKRHVEEAKFGPSPIGSTNFYRQHCAEEESLRRQRNNAFDQALCLEEDYVDDPADLINSHPDLFSRLFREIAA